MMLIVHCSLIGLVLVVAVLLTRIVTLRSRCSDIVQRLDQLEVNVRHLQRELKSNDSQIKLITLENSNTISAVKTPAPSVLFSDTDSFWLSQSAVRQQKKHDSGLLKTSSVQLGSKKQPAGYRVFFRWLLLAAAILGVTLAELYWEHLISIDILCVSGIIFLFLAGIIAAAVLT